MLRRLVLCLFLAAMGFAPMAQATPCLMAEMAASAHGMTMQGCNMVQKNTSKAEKSMVVADCFANPAVSAAPVTSPDIQQAQPDMLVATLPELVTLPGAVIPSKVQDPPPTALRVVPTRLLLATFSRWLV